MRFLALLMLAGCVGSDITHEGTTHFCVLAVCPHIGVDVDTEREKKKKEQP